jgi:hypothetical protein
MSGRTCDDLLKLPPRHNCLTIDIIVAGLALPLRAFVVGMVWVRSGVGASIVLPLWVPLALCESRGGHLGHGALTFSTSSFLVFIATWASSTGNRCRTLDRGDRGHVGKAKNQGEESVDDSEKHQGGRALRKGGRRGYMNIGWGDRGGIVVVVWWWSWALA